MSAENKNGFDRYEREEVDMNKWPVLKMNVEEVVEIFRTKGAHSPAIDKILEFRKEADMNLVPRFNPAIVVSGELGRIFGISVMTKDCYDEWLLKRLQEEADKSHLTITEKRSIV